MNYSSGRHAAGGLVSLLGANGPTELDRQRALERQMGAQLAPFQQAIESQRAGATSAALTAGQSSGNPFLAQRMAAQAGDRAAAPLLAQRAAAQSQVVNQAIEQQRQERIRSQQHFERFLGAGLQGGATLLGGLLQGFGGSGGQQGGAGAGTASGLPGATITGPTPEAQQAYIAQHAPNLAQGGGTAAAGGGPTRPPPDGQVGTVVEQFGRRFRWNGTAWEQIDAQGNPAGAQPVAMAQPQQAGGGNALGQIAGIASLVPGYGTAIGAGLNGLGALFGAG